MYTEKILKLLIASKQMSVSLSRHKYPEIPFYCKFTAVNVSGSQDYYTGQVKTLVPGFVLGVGESISSIGNCPEFTLGRIDGDDPEKLSLVETSGAAFYGALTQEVKFLKSL
jgi:hypothetical protein